MNAENIRIETDERGFELHITGDGYCCGWQAVAELLASTMRGHPGFLHRADAERVALVAFDDLKARDDGRRIINVQAVAEELYDGVKANIGPWLQERDAVKAEFDRRDPYADEDDGPWPGESVQSYYERTGQDGPLREVADALNKARKEAGA